MHCHTLKEFRKQVRSKLEPVELLLYFIQHAAEYDKPIKGKTLLKYYNEAKIATEELKKLINEET